MNQADFETAYERVPTERRVNFIIEETKNDEDSTSLSKKLLSRFLSFFPILYWLPRYRLKQNLFSDFISGLTVGIMTVPQGMAYASLAKVPPVYGLYASFFSAFFYLFFGTSRHISIGVFAVCSLMVGSVRLRLIPEPITTTSVENGSIFEETTYPPGAVDVGYELTPMMVVSSLTFVVGVVQVLMALCRLTFVTTYMTDQLVSGYTTGSAFHVLIAQFDKLFGVKIKHHEGVGMLFFMVRDVVLSISNAPIMVLGLSTIGLIYLVIGKDYINPVVKKYSPVPVPHELILVIAATMFSRFVNAKEDYGVRIVDNIPQGMPSPVLPNFDIMKYMIMDAIPIAIICYMFIISMGKLFAKKHKYKVDDNQELYAIGFTSILSSFFPTYPAGASLSRSSVCEASGVKTQLYIVFSSSLLFIVIAWLGPLLEPLPMCILACIVTVSLKSLFMQFKELPRLWKISRIDFAIWVVACAATVITDATKGLAIALVFVLFTVLIREQWPKVYHLFANTSRDIFKPAEIYQGLAPVGDRVTILKFNSPLHFANVSKFTSAVNELFSDGRDESVSPTTISSEKQSDEYLTTTFLNGHSEKKRGSFDSVKEALFKDKKLVLDCSAISYVDTMGVDALREAYLDGEKAGTVVLFADFTEPVLDTLEVSGFFSKVPKECLFPSIRHAILAAGVSEEP
uniref:STAS domain-containing protein n=1 Tax=Acrobeloides nanus TaxID=290746 RepID=A0A914CTY9_9BILA